MYYNDNKLTAGLSITKLEEIRHYMASDDIQQEIYNKMYEAVLPKSGYY